MARSKKSVTLRKQRLNKIEHALRLVRNDGLTPWDAAKQAGCVYQTVRRRIGGQKEAAKAHEKQQLLSDPEEDALKQYVEDRAAAGMALSYKQLTDQVERLLRRRGSQHNVGKNWVKRFVRKGDLKARKVRGTSLSRVKAANEKAVDDWLDTLRKHTDGLDPRSIWAMDETFCRGDRHIPSQVHSGGDREGCTTLEAISAAGTNIAPQLIYRGERVQPSWRGEAPESFRIIANGKTCMGNGLTMEDWFIKHFEPLTRDFCTNGRRLLVIDGAPHHCTFPLVLAAKEAHIDILTYPANMTQFLQPHDVKLFGDLKKRLSDFLARDARTRYIHDGVRCPGAKLRFASVYAKAREASFSEARIQAAFAESGLWPIDKTPIPTSAFVIPAHAHDSLAPLSQEEIQDSQELQDRLEDLSRNPGGSSRSQAAKDAYTYIRALETRNHRLQAELDSLRSEIDILKQPKPTTTRRKQPNPNPRPSMSNTCLTAGEPLQYFQNENEACGGDFAARTASRKRGRAGAQVSVVSSSQIQAMSSTNVDHHHSQREERSDGAIRSHLEEQGGPSTSSTPTNATSFASERTEEVNPNHSSSTATHNPTILMETAAAALLDLRKDTQEVPTASGKRRRLVVKGPRPPVDRSVLSDRSNLS
ncbi:hypothetical protein CF319_g8701 [Tilletia indica]|nr:hypothetical protein CF319_g8701 [Tilletia indica]